MGKFYNWIANNFQGPVILVAHGAFSKHARFLVEDFQSTGYKNDRIQNIIVGFSDTLVAFPEYFKGVYFSHGYLVVSYNQFICMLTLQF